MDNKKIKREEWADIAKGLGILSVILGHMGVEQINCIVYTYHLPVFFILSGYFMKKKDDSTCLLIKSRTLLLPYFFTCILICIGDLKKEEAFRFPVIIDEVLAEVPVIFYKNNEPLADDYVIKPMDRLTTESVITLEDLLSYMESTFDPKDMIMTINGVPADQTTLISAGDHISFVTEIPETPLETENLQSSVILEENNIAPESKEETLQQNSEEMNFSDDPNSILVCINGAWKTIPLQNQKKLLFYDMLNYVDIDLEKPQGNIILKLNGEDTSYTSIVSPGDSIEIGWENPE